MTVLVHGNLFRAAEAPHEPAEMSREVPYARCTRESARTWMVQGSGELAEAEKAAVSENVGTPAQWRRP